MKCLEALPLFLSRPLPRLKRDQIGLPKFSYSAQIARILPRLLFSYHSFTPSTWCFYLGLALSPSTLLALRSPPLAIGLLHPGLRCVRQKPLAMHFMYGTLHRNFFMCAGMVKSGRHTGLKIPGTERSVPVQFRLPAPKSFSPRGIFSRPGR